MKMGFAAVLFACFASAGHAATLSIAANQSAYGFGDTVTLTVTGDSQGASSLAVFGRLLFTWNFFPPNVSGSIPTQNTLLALGSIPWIVGPLSCNSFSCDMMFQLSAFGLNPAPASNLLVSTVSFLYYGGDVDISWETNPATGFQLDFFGLTNAPGITISEIPEPATALLLGLGLAGFALARCGRA